MTWLTSLKIAIVEKNTDTISKLLDETPKFTNKDEMQEAMYILKEARKMLHALQDEVSASMLQIKKNIEFLQSTQPANKNTLDVSS